MSTRLRAFGALALAGVIGLSVGGGFVNPKASVEAGVLAVGSNTYGTGLVVVNQSASATANITINAYKDGALVTLSGFPSGYTDSIPANNIKSFCSCSVDDNGNVTDALFKLLPSNSLVSFVVSADQPIAASVNTQRVVNPPDFTGSASQPFRIGTSAGISDIQTAQAVYAPQVLKNLGGFNSRVYVQCASSTDCANTTWNLFDRNTGASVATFQQTIKAFSSFEFDPNGAQTSGLPGNSMYSLKVQSAAADQKLALATNFFNSGNDASTSQFHAYNGAGAGDTKLYAPRVVRKYFDKPDTNPKAADDLDYNSGMRVQNIGTVATTVRFAYSFASAGNANCSALGNFTNDITGVVPGQSVGPYMGDDVGPDAGAVAQPLNLPKNCTGSLVVTSIGEGANAAQPLVGIVNEDSRNLGQGSTYNMFRDNEATTKAVIPQVVNKLGNTQLDKIANGGGFFVSGVQYQNIGVADANCVVTITGKSSGNDVTFTMGSNTLSAGASASLFLATIVDASSNALAGAFNGAARIDCGAAKVVAVANLSVRNKGNPGAPNGVGDSATTANALSQ